MNAVVVAVITMLALSLSYVHAVFSLAIGALVGSLVAGMLLENVTSVIGDVVQQGIIPVFNGGLKGGAQIALSYAMPGAFAIVITHFGLLQQPTGVIIRKLNGGEGNVKDEGAAKQMLLAVISCMGVTSQNTAPIRIAFIPVIILPSLLVFNRLKLDHCPVVCITTFDLVTAHMFLPYGFGTILLSDIMSGNIRSAGMDTGGINVMHAMMVPALSMMSGLLLAFLRYRKPRIYQNNAVNTEDNREVVQQQGPSIYRNLAATVAIAVCSATQLLYDGSLVLGAMLGFVMFMMLSAMNHSAASDVSDEGIKMMTMVDFIMIAVQGFAAVTNMTGDIQPLVERSMALLGSDENMAAFTTLFVGLLVTMGIGSSFSTLPTITAIYVSLCISLGFPPTAIVTIVSTISALGDTDSPVSDSTPGPTMGLNTDGQRDHIRGSVIPTFTHYNVSLTAAGWIAAMAL